VPRDNEQKLYPLLFAPVYREIMWGGDLMSGHLGRRIPKTRVPVAEAWEIVDREDAVSVVENGPLSGETLRSLIETRREETVGDSKLTPQGRFPLLVKLIDAGKRLSLQVHPDQAACAAHPGAEPKTEMWYIVAAKPEGRIFAGLKSSCTQRQFIKLASLPEVEECLQSFKSAPGDAYFINAGTVHAIGAGNLLLEIQQNSDTTYRISDWGRLGADGKPRELHLEQALECVNFADRSSPRIPAVADEAKFNRKFPIVNKCPFFHVDNLLLVDDWRDDTGKSTFHLITAIDNGVAVESGSGTVEVERGRTCMVPATTGAYKIIVGSERTSVIKTIPQ